MKYIYVMIATLFISSCASAPKEIAELKNKFEKCLLNKSSYLSSTEKEDELLNLEAEYASEKVKAKIVEKDCTKEELEKIVKFSKCLLAGCEKAGNFADNVEKRKRNDDIATECYKSESFKPKDLSEKCMKVLNRRK